MAKTADHFRGKTIIITGAGSGIGKATALIFAREGANVVCADINQDAAEHISEQIRTANGAALALPVDVTSRQQVDRVVSQSLETFRNVDFLFNSAGAALRRSKFLDIDETLFDKTFALNVKGTFYCMSRSTRRGINFWGMLSP